MVLIELVVLGEIFKGMCDSGLLDHPVIAGRTAGIALVANLASFAMAVVPYLYPYLIAISRPYPTPPPMFPY